jgi:hypothetical protein
MANHKNLLISEPPLQVLPTLAATIGLNEAIVLQQLHYWIENPKNDGFIDKEGTKWIFNTYEQWHDNFPFWSEHTIQRIFLNLEKMEIVVSDQLSRDTHDKTKYYRIDYANLEASNMPGWHYRTPQDVALHDANLALCIDESETTTETTTEIKRVPILKSSKAITGIEASIMLNRPTTQADMDAENKGFPGSETIPEAERELLIVYNQLTGQRPTRSQLITWQGAAQEWLELGAQPCDIQAAYRKAHPEKGDGFMVSRPGSLTNTIGMIVGERHINFQPALTKEEKQMQEFEDLSRRFTNGQSVSAPVPAYR